MVKTDTPFQEGAETHPYELAIVAHLDDDLLFMNPDITASIHAGHAVRCVYMVAMIAVDEPDYWRNRELGVKAAYAFMAGVANTWQTGDHVIGNRVIQVESLREAPHVSLIFLRLPDIADPRPDVVTLRDLCDRHDDIQITTVDAHARFKRQELVELLTGIMEDCAATVIRLQDWQTTLDNDSHFGHPGADHPDHIRTVALASEAVTAYARPHTVTYYRNYNIQDEPVNLLPEVSQEKRDVFMQYAAHDSLIGSDCVGRLHCEPLAVYEPWLLRQYYSPQP